MYLRILAAAAAAMTFSFVATAEAKPWDYWDDRVHSRVGDDEDQPSRRRTSRSSRVSERQSVDDADEAPSRRRTSQATRVASRQVSDDGDSVGNRSGLGPRPGAWCGWYMRSRHGGGPEFNLAANWRKWGSPGSPQIGAIVVWDHHVGEIVGKADNGQWIILSGNDGGAVRTRPRSIAGATIRV